MTIFIALLDEGVDVWRPAHARPLARGLFRIIGVEADTSEEIWQFPVGAVVRCENKQFADGKSGLAAVEQVKEVG